MPHLSALYYSNWPKLINDLQLVAHLVLRWLTVGVKLLYTCIQLKLIDYAMIIDWWPYSWCHNYWRNCSIADAMFIDVMAPYSWCHMYSRYCSTADAMFIINWWPYNWCHIFWRYQSSAADATVIHVMALQLMPHLLDFLYSWCHVHWRDGVAADADTCWHDGFTVDVTFIGITGVYIRIWHTLYYGIVVLAVPCKGVWVCNSVNFHASMFTCAHLRAPMKTRVRTLASYARNTMTSYLLLKSV